MDIFEDFDAAYGKGCYTSMSDGLGGENIMHDGMVVGHEAPMGTMSPEGTLRILNHEGGTDVLEGGQVQSHSVGNAMGGQNIYHDGQLHHITTPNPMGGVNVYDDTMHLEGISMDNGIGGENYLAMGGNVDAITQYDNPLAHSAECRFAPFDAAKTL